MATKKVTSILRNVGLATVAVAAPTVISSSAVIKAVRATMSMKKSWSVRASMPASWLPPITGMFRFRWMPCAPVKVSMLKSR